MCALCALSSFIFAQAPSLWVAKAARFLTGFSSAFAFVGTLKLAQLWFPASRFGLLAGSTQALGMLGAAIGAGPVAALVEALGWKQAMHCMGYAVLAIAVLIGLLVREHPAQRASAEAGDRMTSGLLSGLWVVFKNPQSWVNALFAGLIYAPTAAFAELWGPTYLTHVRGMSHVLAASAVSMIFLGWALGGPINGMLADKMGKRKPSLYVSALLSALFLALALYWPNVSSHGLFALLFLFGVANTGLVNAYAISGEINSPNVSGVSMAFCNMVSVTIGALYQPLMGWLLNQLWDGQMLEGVKVYSAHAYHFAALGLPLCVLASAVVAIGIQETYCRPVA